MICHNCNAENSDVANFCRKCGTAVNQKNVTTQEKIIGVPTSASEEQKVCPTCGAVYSTTINFCKKDGTQLISSQLEQLPTTMTADVPSNTLSDSQLNDSTLMCEGQEECKPDHHQEDELSTLIVSPLPTPVSSGHDEETNQLDPDLLSPEQTVVPDNTDILSRLATPKKLAVAGIVIVLLIAGVWGYLQVTGSVKSSSTKIADEINAGLKSGGLKITCQIDNNWVATLQGKVNNPSDGDKALAIVKEHQEITKVINAIVIAPTNQSIAGQDQQKIVPQSGPAASNNTENDNIQERISNYLTKGKRYHEDGKFAEARRMYRTVLKMDKTNKAALSGIEDANMAEKALLER